MIAKIFFFQLSLFALMSSFLTHDASAITFKEEKSVHFVASYEESVDVYWVKRMLREAERYYNKVADQIGYARYKDFWTWDERVKIVVYPNQEVFNKRSGQPAWSRGGVIHFRDNNRLKTRIIVTFKEENKFIDEVLPHEVSHLILRDFIGFNKSIPRWFDEGVAQLHERGKKEKAEGYMRSYVRRGQYLPFREMFRYNIKEQKDPIKVAVFYAQSVSIVHFLIKKYGSQKFGQICKNLQDGYNFEAALKRTYSQTFDSIEALEKKWLSYMQY